jgi:oxygen-dependent protoporphyrinogen oxidase
MTVGIVGGGITGLALTHYLAEAGVDSVTYEAAPAAGGVVSSRRVDGHVLEAGPQRLRKTPGIVDLARAAGVADDLIEANEGSLFVYADGALGEAPLSARQFLRTDLLSWRGKLRLLAEPLTRPGCHQETVAEVFTRKFGRESYERFVGPLYGGLYGSDPAEMPAAFALEGLLERARETGSLLRAVRRRLGSDDKPPAIAVEGGNQQLPVALAETYADRVAFETPVRGVERDGDGYLLHTAAGRRAVDALVVTTPADTAAELLADVAPSAAVLSELQYNPLALVFLEADHGREGKGYQVGYGEDLHTLGVSWNTHLFDREGVNTAFLGGMHDPDLVEASDDRLGAVASEEFERVVGEPASVIDVARLSPGYPAWDHSWWALDDLELPPDLVLATNYTGRMGIPSRVREARALADRFATTAGASAGSPTRTEPVTADD